MAVCFAVVAFATIDDQSGDGASALAWSRLVDIDYVLACDPTQEVDVAVSAYNGSTALRFPPMHSPAIGTASRRARTASCSIPRKPLTPTAKS
jgi:hypothetical protein